ncbi:hypothetical protein ACLOJK_026082 [Asimina triloba]
MEGTKEEESAFTKPEPRPPMALLRQQRKGKGKAASESWSGTARARAAKEMLKERDRRGKMNEFYASLNAMVPTLFPRATREKSIDDTIEYIRELEGEIMELEGARQKKAEVSLHRRRNSCSSIDVSFSGETVFFGIQSKARKGLLSRVLEVFEKHQAEVLATTVASHEGQLAMVTVTAVFNHSDLMVLPPALASQRIKSDLLSSL